MNDWHPVHHDSNCRVMCEQSTGTFKKGHVYNAIEKEDFVLIIDDEKVSRIVDYTEYKQKFFVITRAFK
jgi:hypothetical protein